MTTQSISVIVTCEHGGNRIPSPYGTLFRSAIAQQELQSHRGYDPGALAIAKILAKTFAANIFHSTVSRLLVDLNRCLDSPQLFSEFVPESVEQRSEILRQHYTPYRRQVTDEVAAKISEEGRVVHLSIHTFTGQFRGEERDFDIGVLYDPKRCSERRFAERTLESLRLRRFAAFANRPYLGTDDGLTTTLRQTFAADQYIGIEIEINNRIASLSEATQTDWAKRIGSACMDSLLDAASER
ncbi:N-formylglutamate amidohydrolase [Roseimaritima multifibrata]|uniref:N-formylglutamate amidohydrolase n=1 Tax=Roseimaritima multifibrata TaxID=1930274 RepID=A0A517MHZ9_9BACT|nr:N-formylglutamate amidohydrolase [Roseimaritima multifibrata]QDS94502.1 N-formylglutamate amidohydrolase [Roseimaritima multifibrata]